MPFTAGPQPSLPPLPSSMQRSGDSDAGPSAANEARAPSNVTGGSAGNSGFQSARSFGGTVASASLNAARGVAGAGANQNRRFSLSFSQGVSYANVAFQTKQKNIQLCRFYKDSQLCGISEEKLCACSSPAIIAMISMSDPAGTILRSLRCQRRL